MDTRPRIVTVQYLRAIAALLVVWFHASWQWLRISGVHIGFPESIGTYGVDMFFVISGFIMWTTTSEATTPIAFLYRRMTRIAPLYWLATAALIVVAYVAPQILSTTKLDLFHAAASLLFLPSRHPVTGSIEPLIIPGWTLNYEMAFYAIFAVCLLLPRKWLSLGVTVLLTALVTLGTTFNLSSTPAIFYTNNIVLEFAAGVAIGHYYTNVKSIAPWLSTSFLVGGCFFIGVQSALFSYLPRGVRIGFPAALILTGCVFIERSFSFPRSKGLLLVGAASYSIYLTHFGTLPIVRKIWLSTHGSEASFRWMFILISVIFSTIVGLVCYRLVELPLLTLLRTKRCKLRTDTI
jgi:exopolysaccharide production protein ExoZ